MAIVGDRAWWLPSFLDRLLPDLDIEGDGLLAHLRATTDPERELEPTT
jgi:RND superfamily putative drug exporter